MIEPISRGVLDSPPSRGMTAEGMLNCESWNDSRRRVSQAYRKPSYTMKPRAIASLRKARGTSFSGRCR